MIADIVNLEALVLDDKSQSRMVKAVHNVTLNDVRANLSRPELARLLSQGADSGWVTATPTQQVLQLANKHFSRAVVERV
jgi:hypothetical protein